MTDMGNTLRRELLNQLLIAVLVTNTVEYFGVLISPLGLKGSVEMRDYVCFFAGR